MATELHRKLTSDQFLQVTAPEDVEFELSEGEIVILTKPGPYHQQVVARLERMLASHCEATGWGQVFWDVLVRLSDQTTRAPDISGVRRERLDIVGSARLNQPPDLAVEVHSQNRAEDLGPKFDQYQSAGIPFYWLVDPLSKTVHAYSLGPDGRYVLEWQGRDAEVFKPAGMPGLEIPLSELWAPA